MRAWVRNSLIFIILLILVLAAAAFFLLRGQTSEYTLDQLSGPDPIISEPRVERFPTINVAEIIGWEDGEAPVVAEGLMVSSYAQGLDHPRQMYRLPNGDLLVAETNSPPRDNKGIEGWVMRNLMSMAGAGTASANRISLLRDADGDGVAEQKTTFLEGLNSPFGMALVGDTLYVANTDAVLAFPYAEGATKITAKGEKIAALNAEKPNNHWTRNLIASPDGNSLFVAVGSNSNIGENGKESEKQRAAILEIQLNKNNEMREYSSGLRNPVGMDIHPVTGGLWTVVNERDMLGPDLVPDYLAEVGLGTQFGWPHYYWGGRIDGRVDWPLYRDESQYIRAPDYALGTHVAPLGVVFSHESAFCGDFAKGAFIARHGSWNRKPASGYDVVYVSFADDGEPDGALPVNILTGFLAESGDARGRPTMVEIDATGALLVSDDVSNIIWRVAPKPGSCPPADEAALDDAGTGAPDAS